MQVIVFSLNEKLFAIPTNKVSEITKSMPLIKVPNAPDWVEGLINLRGNVVTLINLSKILFIEDKLCYNSIIILNYEDDLLGLLVDEVEQVLNIKEEQIQILKKEDNQNIMGIVDINNKIIDVIDIEKLVEQIENKI
ncbi:purine-binding chemotaxis protein CheW [Soehngenia saccharolytica]|nr:purine-binding chemotaxis protein CheW [Soehngenia saccharolytica]